ncbi:HupE/UreJ family protein [Thalassotalea sp. G2M2-11]|uniref:HupE/UreJ family protein n=1 Tax=Thalassotalea sp. G2M2-11 TaxID=2787627 RepID=UPI0019D23B63|nr:HupE/UreJ family protein [Thalassotalea sp. G2M2-11]
MRASYFLILLYLLSCYVTAHDARPIVIDINQHNSLVRVDVKMPAAVPVNTLPKVHINARCVTKQQGAVQLQPGAYVQIQLFNCQQTIAGQTLTLDFPAANPSLSTLVKVRLDNGQFYTQLLAPDETLWSIPQQESVRGVIWQYSQMGVMHILKGWDHLLFVLCLLVLAGNVRGIALTVTGFTLGHSITLIATSLNWLHFPVALCELLIALSIVFLAVEIAKGDKTSWSYQYPATVATLFGLLHGVGFASVLREIGLPQVELLWGLISFNVGIELGQLVFIVAVVTLIKLLSHLFPPSKFSQLQYPLGIYLIGSVAAFWFWERSILIFYPEI